MFISNLGMTFLYIFLPTYSNEQSKCVGKKICISNVNALTQVKNNVINNYFIYDKSQKDNTTVTITIVMTVAMILTMIFTTISEYFSNRLSDKILSIYLIREDKIRTYNF